MQCILQSLVWWAIFCGADYSPIDNCSRKRSSKLPNYRISTLATFDCHQNKALSSENSSQVVANPPCNCLLACLESQVYPLFRTETHRTIGDHRFLLVPGHLRIEWEKLIMACKLGRISLPKAGWLFGKDFGTDPASLYQVSRPYLSIFLTAARIR